MRQTVTFSKAVFMAMLLVLSLALAACSSGSVGSGDKQHPGNKDTFFVTLNTLGGEDWQPIRVESGDTLQGRVDVPTKEGFTFLGWSISSDSFVKYDMSSPVTSNFTLYAAWSGAQADGENIYRLTVHLQDGAFRNMPVNRIDIDYKSGKQLQELPRMNTLPDHSTLVFAGWNTSPDGRGDIIMPDTVLTSDLEIYAIYGALVDTVDKLKSIECNNSDVFYVMKSGSSNFNELSGTEWVPLCADPSKPFKGAFYGRTGETSTPEFKIANPLTHAGLFAYTDGALFNNVRIRASISGTATYAGLYAGEMKNSRIENSGGNSGATVASATYAGTLLGKGDNITIRNSNVSAYNVSGQYAGGAAGYLLNSTLHNVQNGWNVTANAADARIGGVVGYMEGGTLSFSGHSDSSYTVSSKFENTYAGMVAGYLKNVQATALFNVRGHTLTIEHNNSFGGMAVGVMSGGSLTGAQLYGKVNALGDNSAAGGVVGKAEDGAVIKEVVTSANVYATGLNSTAGGVVGVSSNSTLASALVLSEEIKGTTANMFSTTAGTDNQYRAGIMLNNTYPSNGLAVVNMRHNKAFFKDTMKWDLGQVWEMKDYYDYPTFVFDNVADFIKITTPEQLAAIGADRDSMRKNYVLMNDIDLSTYNGGLWEPLGKELRNLPGGVSYYFYGIFNGNGKAIKNLKINESASSRAGLFDSLIGPNQRSYAIVRDLILENVNIANTYSSGGNFSGSVSGDANSRSLIEFVRANGTVNGRVIGGLIGSGKIYIYDSFFDGNLVSVQGNAGGLLGSSADLDIVRSGSTGTITITSTAGANAGGIATATGTSTRINACYSTMSITVSSTGTGLLNVGGVVSTMGQYSVVKNSYSTGNISVTGGHATNNVTGGISGSTTRESVLLNNAALMNSVSAARGRVGRITGYVYTNATYPERMAIVQGNVANPALAHGGSADGNEGTDMAVIDEAAFQNLGWDMNYVWKFDSVKNRPVFLWQ